MSAIRESRRLWVRSSVFQCLLVGLALGPTTGCASNTERWAEVSMKGLGYQNLYHSVLDMLELEGYRVGRSLPDAGVIETQWLRGVSRREVRGPSRRKAHLEIKHEEGARQYMVRIRVEEQIIRKGGMLSSGNHQEKDWEAFPDNFDDAEYLAAKLRALLADYAIKVEATEEPEEYYK